MERFTRSDLQHLAHTTAHPSVSIYMPTFHVESEWSQNPIRFRNLLREARQTLHALDLPNGTAEAVLRPAEAKLEDEAFWHRQRDGLAVFLHDGEADFHRIPLDVDELAFVGSRLYLKPLFPLIATNNLFYVLALSQNEVRLFQGTHFSIDEVHTTEIPKDITSALFYDDPERQLQGHTGSRASSGRGDMIFHGHGGSDLSDDATRRPHDRLHRFFQEVDKGVAELLEGETAPLLLAGVEYYLPIYRAANSYNHLVENAIVAGNQETVTAQELHEKAWAVMEPRFQTDQHASIEAFGQHSGTQDGLASRDVSEIVPAARFGRIDTLFVPIGEHRWGRFDEDALRVELHDTRASGDDDLLDFAAVHTYLNGGTVHAMRRENMPVDDALAAVFRYPAEVTAEVTG